MSRPCIVCRDERRAEVDAALLVRGQNLSEVARSFGIQRKSLERHRNSHLSSAAAVARESLHTLDVVRQIVEMKAIAHQILDEALADKERREALAALREVRELLVVLAKLQGLFDEAPRKIIDQRTQVVALVDKLSVDELRALADQARTKRTLTP